MGMVKSGAYIIAMLFVATMLGGVLGAFGDMYLGDLIVGTPLGPRSGASPMLWTAIAFGAMYAVNEVRD